MVSLAVSDGAHPRLAAGCAGGEIHMLDPATGQSLSTIRGHSADVQSLHWAAFPQKAVASEVLEGCTAGEPGEGKMCTTSGSGAPWLASASADGTINVWSSDGTLFHSLKLPKPESGACLPALAVPAHT